MQKILEKDPRKRATIQDCLEHVTFKDINKQKVAEGKFKPGVEPSNSKDMSSFMQNFSEDFTSLSKNLDDGEGDIRALAEDEDRAFSEFNWMNEQKVRNFQR